MVSDSFLSTTRRNTMSNRFGVEIKVDVYAVYEQETLKKFAKKAGITLGQAESLAKNTLYRKAYAKLRNQLPEVKEKRKEENRKRNQLAKQLNQLAN
jgi:lipid-binding SYLF domain-containing protein